jgi:para-nitrobenzyl esterase
MERLISASRATNAYGPVLDGRTLPRSPFSPDAPTFSAQIPFMVGTNHDETRALIGETNEALFDLSWDTLNQNLARYSASSKNACLNKEGSSNWFDRVVSLYRQDHPEYSASDVFFAATTDSSWRWSSLLEVERRAVMPHGSAATYAYELRWGSPVDRGKYKACHGLDLPLIFDTVSLSHRMTATGPDAYELAEKISETYIAFARSGDPNNGKIPHWPPYDLARRSTLVFDKKPMVIDDPRGEERKLFSVCPL